MVRNGGMWGCVKLIDWFKLGKKRWFESIRGVMDRFGYVGLGGDLGIILVRRFGWLDGW